MLVAPSKARPTERSPALCCSEQAAVPWPDGRRSGRFLRATSDRLLLTAAAPGWVCLLRTPWEEFTPPDAQVRRASCRGRPRAAANAEDVYPLPERRRPRVARGSRPALSVVGGWVGGGRPLSGWSQLPRPDRLVTGHWSAAEPTARAASGYRSTAAQSQTVRHRALPVSPAAVTAIGTPW